MRNPVEQSDRKAVLSFQIPTCAVSYSQALARSRNSAEPLEHETQSEQPLVPFIFHFIPWVGARLAE